MGMNSRIRNVSTSRSPGGLSRLKVAVATMSLTVAACSVAVTTVTPTEPLPSASVAQSPRPETPVPSPTASPTPEPVWQLSSIPPMFIGCCSHPVAVTAGEAEFVAVGDRTFRDNVTPSGGTAGAWRSVDGLTWEPAMASADLAVGDWIPMSGPEPGFVDVAWGPAGFVAVGIALDGEPGAVFGGVWHSMDGRDWTRSELPLQTFARPTSVTWNGSQYVIVGVGEAKDAPRAAVWLSPDGRSWRRVTDGAVFDIGHYIDTGEYHGWGGPTDVASAPDGVVYAVGQTCSGTPGMYGGDTGVTCRPLVWRSPDGETWTTTEPEDAATASSFRSVAASNGRVVAVGGPQAAGGQLADRPARVLIGNGASWQIIEPVGVPRLQRVVAFGQGFLAAATANGEISLWASPDGLAWAAVTGVPQPADVTALRVIDLTVAGDHVVLVGSAEFSSAIGVGGFAIVWSPRG